MLIRKRPEFKDSDVTPQAVYANRRKFLTTAAGLVVAAAGSEAAWAAKLNYGKSSFSTNEKPTSLKDVTSYNNYYEFGTDKGDPSKNAGNFKTNPWTLSVEGFVDKPKKYDYDGLTKIAPLEERIYRHRCVEAWSMVIPWVGFPLAKLLEASAPNSKAKFVAFESYYDGKQMPLARMSGMDLPYREGLRLDEAMNPLTLLAVGLYGETLPNQNGAPIRLVVPWKYGFKGIKSIAKIKLVDKMPQTTWNMINAREYGFYSNVNPEVDHPRWTQASERRIGEFSRRKTVMFNGYGDQVASLYQGLDLKKNY